MLGWFIKFWPLWKLIFAWCVEQYGDDIMQFAMSLVAARDQERNDGKINAREARETNIKLLQQATISSPGLSETECLIINQAAYMRYVHENKTGQWSYWQLRKEKWDEKRKRMKSEDFERMDLYLLPKDRSNR